MTLQKILLPRCFKYFVLQLTVVSRSKMKRLKENHTDSYNLDNCFGFNESGINLSLLEKSSVVNDADKPLEFQPDKPYRLALYVRPNEHKRLQRTKATILMKSNIEKPKTNKKSETFNKNQLVEKNEIRRSSRVKDKINVMLFDENVKPENISKKIQMTPKKDKLDKNLTIQCSTRENVLKEINTKCVSKTKQSKVRRSYEKKFKEKEETENVFEPPSEQILKDLEFKKLSRTKPKKTKEQQEFEKWANNMNSAFDDVDKFELSIAYD